MSSKSIMSNGSGGSFRQSSLHEKLHYTSSGEEKVKLAGDESKDRMYEPKRDKKMMRVVTVVIYVFSVSLAAIMLSLYYVFFWHPTGPHYVNHHAAAAHAPANVTTTTSAVAPSCLHGTKESTDSTVGLNEEVAFSQYPVNLMYEDDTGSTEMTTDTTFSSDPSMEMLFDPITAPTKLSRILGIQMNHEERNKSSNNRPKRNE